MDNLTYLIILNLFRKDVYRGKAEIYQLYY